MKQVNAVEAIQQLFLKGKRVYVKHHANGIDFTKELVLGKNISVTTEIPVTVILHGEWYIID